MAGRGIDFEQRFKTSRWAEDLLLTSFNKHPDLVAIRYGLSQVRADGDVVFNRFSAKEPDLLVYRKDSLTEKECRILADCDLSHGNRADLMQDNKLNFVFKKALIAVEVEFSPYRASEMRGRNWQPKTPDEWNRRPLKHANPPVAPNIWVKEEDLGRLSAWQSEFKVPIIIAHLFDQEAFAVTLHDIISFNSQFETPSTDVLMLQMTTGIFKKEQTYDRQDAQGAREKKIVFVVSPAVSVKIGCVDDVKVQAQLGVSASKKYVTHSIFSGGRISFTDDFISMLIHTRR